VIWPLLLIVLDRVIFARLLYSKDITLYLLLQTKTIVELRVRNRSSFETRKLARATPSKLRADYVPRATV
jgi:hypothetical protein